MALTKPKLSQNIDTDISVFTDPILVLHQGSTLANVDTGFLFNRANGLVSNVAIYWSESANSFVTAFTTSSGAPDANVAPTRFANIRVGTATANILQSDQYRYSNGAAFVSTTIANSAEIVANLSSGENVGLSLTATGVLAGNYGSATSIPTIVVDSKGRITSVTANSVSTTINLAGGSGSGSVAGGGTLTIDGTANQITTSVSSSTVTLAFAQDITTPGNLTVAGNLVVQGNTTTLNTETLTVEDLNITVANGAINSAAADGAGLTVGGADARLLYKSSTDSWIVNKGLFAAGNLVANSGTASTSTTSGALVVTGGAGIAGNVYTDKLYTTTGLFWAGNGNAVVTGSSSFSQIAVTGGNTLVANSSGTSTLTVVGGSGISIIADAATDTLTFTTIEDSIWMADHDSGLVTDGVTVSEDNGLVTDSTTDSYDLGSIVVTGVITGDTIAANTIPGDRLITGTDITVGNITVAAGSAIIPDTDNTGFIGNTTNTWANGQFTNLTIDSTLSVRAAIDLADSDVLRLGSSDDWEFFHNGTDNYIDLNVGDLRIRDNTTQRVSLSRSTGNLVLDSTTTSTSSTTGALVVKGGVGISGNIVVGENIISAVAGGFGSVSSRFTANTGTKADFHIASSVNGASATATQQYGITFAPSSGLTQAAILISENGADGTAVGFYTTNSYASGPQFRAFIDPTGHLLPGANVSYDLGSTTLRWRNIYTGDLNLSNGRGDYTIVEGEEDLFLYNNRTGKTYKFVVQEVDPSTVPPKLR